MAPVATGNTDRDALTSRILPQMTLSTGDETSMTGPPPPMPHVVTPISFLAVTIINARTRSNTDVVPL